MVVSGWKADKIKTGGLIISQTKYLCTSWQGFVQQIIHNIAHGYHYYSAMRLPEKKREQWYHIDAKLKERFNVDIPRWKRYRNKKAGKANYLFLRYDYMAIILKTEGNEECPECLKEPFLDIGKEPLIVRPTIDSELQLSLHRKAQKGFTVHLTRDCYKNLKSLFMELLDKRQLEKLKYRFDSLNGIPAYAGIIEHKKKLLDIILKTAKKHGIALKRSDFRLSTKRYIYKVFD